ncbi:hypothetical protein [Nostoc sp. UHCC 0251]|uniref:hypothetical protein n=1 Tax=Nostoc sp. UHCC 0251 TaxID=3110240 RepID=UPI002B202F22|nr:hypothetical protein [Nostoc sp. UHCC 0251]MEA5622810.1 hypothetical protein [Nostoc sp. UHCC 0251]
MKKNSVLTTILVLGIAICGVLPGRKALSQTSQICASSSIPTGFVVTSISTNFIECGNSFNNLLIIQNASVISPGSLLNVCPSSPTPTGFVVTNISTSFTQCGTSSFRNNIRTIQRADGLPLNTLLNICSSSPVPTGFVVTNSSTSLTQCGGSSFDNIRTIQRVS